MRSAMIILTAAALSLTSCERLEHAISEEGHAPAWEHGTEGHAPTVENAERWTADVEVVRVRTADVTTGDGEQPEVQHEGEFLVAARTPHIEQAPCTQCHGKGEVKKPEGSPRPAHWNITRAHGNAADLTCATCHPSDKPETLRTIHGREVDYDHSYELCGTCHFQQLEDWKGGAHGKRLGAWSGERVVQSCTGCHNPHDPTFPVRTPAIFNPPPAQPGDRNAGEIE